MCLIMPGTIINGMSYYCDMTSRGSQLVMLCLKLCLMQICEEGILGPI